MASKYKEMKTLMEALEEVDNYIVERIRNMECNYTVVGQEQVSNWRGDLEWEDDEKTIPLMRDKWDYVPKESVPAEWAEMCEALKKVRKHLEKML